MRKKKSEERSLYRLYDPISGKFVSNIKPGWWGSRGAKIIYSNAIKSFIISENDLSRFYKRFYDLRLNLEKLRAESMTMHSQSANRKKEIEEHIESLENLIEKIESFELQEFVLSRNPKDPRLESFKNRSSDKFVKSMTKQLFSNEYGWVIAEWLDKESKNDAKHPYAILQMTWDYIETDTAKAQKKLQQEIRSLGIESSWFSRVTNQLEIKNKEDYHLLCMTLDPAKIEEKYLVADLVKEYKELTDKATDFSRSLWFHNKN